MMEYTGEKYPNLFDALPPLQVDGNLGAIVGTSEMLLQSLDCCAVPKTGAEGCILDLLPALPKTWSNGSVKRLQARGGFTVDMTRADSDLVHAEIYEVEGGP